MLRLRMCNKEGHIPVRQKVSIFMSRTKLALNVRLYGKAREGPVALSAHQEPEEN